MERIAQRVQREDHRKVAARMFWLNSCAAGLSLIIYVLGNGHG